MFFYLIFLERLPTRITRKENHFEMSLLDIFKEMQKIMLCRIFLLFSLDCFVLILHVNWNLFRSRYTTLALNFGFIFSLKQVGKCK